MPKNNFVIGLVNAFNLCNYYFDDIYTNFTVEGKRIVGSFVSSTDIKEYSQKIKEEIIKRHYGTEEVADKYYNLNYFPFVLSDKRKNHTDLEVELAGSINSEVIRNLKIHFTREFMIKVNTKVAVNLEERGLMTVEEGYECVKGSVQLERTDRSSPYLYCISFGDRYCKEKGYPSRFLEIFKNIYVTAFDEKLEECGLESSDFYESRDNKLYIKNITDIDVIEGIAEHLRERIALDFKTPGTEDSKVENFKDILSNLIFKWTGKSISAYECIERGDSFFLIPLTKMYGDQLETLKRGDMYRANVKHKNFLRDIKGEAADPDIVNCETPVYAISNKKIAEVLPEIMQSPIAYNGRTGHFEFVADLGPSSSVEFPRHASMAFPVLLPQPGGVAVPGVVDDTKNNPGPSMSGQGSGLPLPGPSQSVDVKKDSSESLKERVLLEYTGSLPLNNNKESRQKILSLFFSHEGRQELYSILSSPREREGLYSDLCISEQCEKWESFWYSLHQREQQPASDKGLFFPSVSDEQTGKELYYILMDMLTDERGYFDMSKAAKVAKSISSSVELDGSHYCKSYLVEVVEAEMKKLGVTPTNPKYIKPSSLVNGHGPLDVSNLSSSKEVIGTH
jgi:hypothetical protein